MGLEDVRPGAVVSMRLVGEGSLEPALEKAALDRHAGAFAEGLDPVVP